MGQECNAGRGRVAKAAVRGSGAAPRHRLPVVQERGARPRGAGQSQERGICAFTQFTFAKCFFEKGEDSEEVLMFSTVSYLFKLSHAVHYVIFCSINYPFFAYLDGLPSPFFRFFAFW